MASQPANASDHVFNHEATYPTNTLCLWKRHSSPRYTTHLYLQDSAWVNEVCSGWYKSVPQNSWHKRQNCPDYYLSAFSTKGEPHWPSWAVSSAFLSWTISLSVLSSSFAAALCGFLTSNPHSIFAFLSLICNLHSLQRADLKSKSHHNLLLLKLL